MAKSGDKKRLEENKAHTRNLLILICVANAVFLIARLYLRKETTSWLHYAGLALTSVIYAFCYGSITYALAPHFNSAGDLVYAGADLKTGGVLSYYHDLLYIASFVQLAGAFTNWAWLAFLLDAPESDLDKKRREKRERQEARAQKFARK
ncbi:hypothetical protein N2152v2_009421 [Parachlorella kessleri]